MVLYFLILHLFKIEEQLCLTVYHITSHLIKIYALIRVSIGLSIFWIKGFQSLNISMLVYAALCYLFWSILYKIWFICNPRKYTFNCQNFGTFNVFVILHDPKTKLGGQTKVTFEHMLCAVNNRLLPEIRAATTQMQHLMKIYSQFFSY